MDHDGNLPQFRLQTSGDHGSPYLTCSRWNVGPGAGEHQVTEGGVVGGVHFPVVLSDPGQAGQLYLSLGLSIVLVICRELKQKPSSVDSLILKESKIRKEYF